MHKILSLVAVSFFSITGFAETPEAQLRKYYLPHFKPSLTHSKDSLLIDLTQNKTSYAAGMLNDFFNHPEQESKSPSLSQREYLVKTWASQFSESSILQNEDLAQHLQVFSGTSAPHLYAKIFPPQTILGEVYGAYLLASGATADIAQIKNRQDLIKSLHANKYSRELILKAAQSVHKVEGSLLDIFQLKGVPADHIRNLNPNWLLLSEPWRLPWLVLKQHARVIFLPTALTALQAVTAGFFSIQAYGLGSCIRGSLWRTGAMLFGAMTVLDAYMMFYQQSQNHQQLYELNISLTRQLKALGVFLEALSLISEELKPPLQTILSSIHQLTEPDDSNFFHANLARAQIITEQVLLQKPTLERLLLRFAQLDFYASVADAQFAYVEFLDTALPSFKATGLRHPSLPSETSIKNDIEIHDKDMLLTGPNASGKSTLMRSVGINIVYLAQILGIGTADSLSLTPFESFHAFMETQDKTGESSSYQTELNRIIKVLRIKKRSFYLADELFSSTNAHDAQIGSQEILSEFSKLDQTLGIVSTHLYALSELPVIQNLHMNQFHLMPNASAQHNALEIFQKEISKPQVAEEPIMPQFSKQLLSEILSRDFKIQQKVKIDSDIWTDLELFSLDLFPTQTAFGNTFGTLFLMQSATDDLATLKKRQEKISLLQQQPNLLSQIRNILSSLQISESSFTEIYDRKNFINSRLVQEQYPCDEEMTSKLMPIDSWLLYLMNRNQQKLLWHNLMYTYLMVPLGLLSEYQLGKWVMSGSASIYSKALFALSTLLGLQGLFQDPTSKHFELSDLNSALSKKLQDTAKVFEAVLQLAALDLQLPEGLRFKITEEEQKTLKQFIWEAGRLDDIETNAYQLNFAQALATFRLLMNIRGPFVQYFKKIGKLDFYAAIAHQMTLDPTGLTFAEFVTDQGAFLEARDLWNPLLPRKTAVTNSISLKNMIITGPNASGKSTLMRSVAISIYLAQTLGVATASSFKLNPFTIFNSFMRHTDATGAESSYQSEVKNMRRMMAIYENMTSKDRAFLILDEPFRSTNPEEAEIASERVLKNLASYPQSLFIVATHLRNLVDFDQKHLENYKLQEGASFESSALSMLREKLLNLDRQ
ncbi:MAG: hypothetical protein WCK42_02880 [Myxococcaceae bacterium]